MKRKRKYDISKMTILAGICVFFLSVVIIMGMGEVPKDSSSEASYWDKTTRKEGSIFKCTAMVGLEGSIEYNKKLQYFIKIFGGKSESIWILRSDFDYDVEVQRNDGTSVTEQWNINKARSLRLMMPPELVDLKYELGPLVKEAIVEASVMAAKWASKDPNPYTQAGAGVAALAGMAIVNGEKVNWSLLAKITGKDEVFLSNMNHTVAMVGKLLDKWEGKKVTNNFQKGKLSWQYNKEVPDDMRQYFTKINALIDYSILPPTNIIVGQTFPVDNKKLNQLIPPELTDLPDYSVDIIFMREADMVVNSRKLAVFNGTGKANGEFTDHSVMASCNLTEAKMLVDITDDQNRFLQHLRIKAPVDGKLIQDQRSHTPISWKGDLIMVVDYTVQLVPPVDN